MSGPTDPKVDEGLQYVMLVLSSAEAFKPDYHSVATAAGIASANTAYVMSPSTSALLICSSQKKFKKLVDTAGFQLVNGAVVAAGPDVVKATPKKPKARAKKTPESTLKKRKLEETEDAEVEDGEAVEGA